MAQRFSPNSSVAEQILLNPTFANIDFADFQGLNMNLIDRNAEYTQNLANKRFEEMVQAQTKLLEDVQLHKRFDYLEKDLQNKLASVIDNAGNVQLSDNANFSKLNTNLISLKTDPQLKKAVYSSEQAKKMQEILEKDPTLEKRPWDAPSAINYKKFLSGETNDFELLPIYKNVDLTEVWDGFFSKLPPKQQEILKEYGEYGLIQAKKDGRDVDELMKSIEDFENFTIKNNPEIVSHLERRGNYEVATNPNIVDKNQFKNQFINDYIKESQRASASKFAGVSNTISSIQMDPNESGRMQQQGLDNSTNQLNALTPITLSGTTLLRGNKAVPPNLQKDFNKQLVTLARKTVIDQEKDPVLKKNMNTLPANLGKTIVNKNTDGTYTAQVVFQPVKAGAASITKIITIPSSQVENIANMYNTNIAPTTGGAGNQRKQFVGVDANGDPIFK